MKKKYLVIEIYDKDGLLKSNSAFLLSDNVTGFICTVSENIVRLYFKNANPFSFISIYLLPDEFYLMIKGMKSCEVKQEGSKFIYAVTEL